jgi:hypothetical protein
VTVYRLVTKHTYEETMLDRASKKLGLEQAVLGEGGGVGGRALDPAELERMLRLGAYHHLSKQDGDAEDEAAFYAANIEDLLAKNTRKVTVDGIRGTVALQLTHGTEMKKLSPAPAVKVDDPDFWQKVRRPSPGGV